jgi:hypothetical protein
MILHHLHVGRYLCRHGTPPTNRAFGGSKLSAVQLIIEPIAVLIPGLDTIKARVNGLHLASKGGEDSREAIHGALQNGSYYRH